MLYTKELFYNVRRFEDRRLHVDNCKVNVQCCFLMSRCFGYVLFLPKLVDDLEKRISCIFNQTNP